MKRDTVDHAVNEARRFLKAVEDLHKRESGEYYYNSPRESGSVKRASMDLTRALADLRRRGQ